jgi:hypothetical protein
VAKLWGSGVTQVEQVVEHLASKCETLSENPTTTKKKKKLPNFVA